MFKIPFLSRSSSKSTTQVSNTAEQNDISVQDINSLADLFGVMPSFAGPAVTPKTSMKVSIVFACVRLIAGAIAQMPVHIFEQSEKNDKQRVPNHSLANLFNLQPTPAWSAAAFWEFIVSSMLLHGDGFAVLLRDRNGDVEEILPISPVGMNVVNNNGRLNYFFTLDDNPRGFDQDDILHFPGFGFNGLKSMSVIQWGAFNSIGLELAMEQHSGEFFKSGSTQRVAVVKQGKWDETQKESFRNAWVKAYGGIENSKFPLVLDNSTDVKQLSVSAKDSQLLESREFQITDIARAFGLPSFMVNQEQKTTSWGSGIGEIGLSFLRFTLGPHLNRFEQEVNRKLFLKKPMFAEFIAANLMRLTLKDRNEAYRQAIGGSQGPGWMSIDEVRKLENLPELGGRYAFPYDPIAANNQQTDN
ncbi:phage portal protein [Pseudoalteromonas sp. MEBiC 03485]|uniref:phage portal protein n=1 Tax=Pseudoalteromonas sp. MEBiC 03485 TaxID=2571103 RepID=UPI00101F002A|nr:phage portal protein [Pseudoalteromonas sp. MEBiC 03485]RZD22389.1 phage portal protein [Pseudoalteromonas sp. MEBiC 03485]